jgi:predicted small lipoprotein YifL
MFDRIRGMHEQGKTSVAAPSRGRFRRAETTLLLLVGLAGLACGCGQKGPLTLPGAAKGSAAPASAASTAATR